MSEISVKQKTLHLTFFDGFGLDHANSMQAAEVGGGHSSREEPLAAVKKHLKTFKASGHNPEANYWRTRDSEGLRKCRIAGIE